MKYIFIKYASNNDPNTVTSNTITETNNNIITCTIKLNISVIKCVKNTSIDVAPLTNVLSIILSFLSITNTIPDINNGVV
ncbi:hypothetical protein DERP_005519 [Dermatophagoides pteronyssinus]|uniref:Uncharacterized protein n=1 Tax=Dermatophagoides pteronyssinus TaxID=6956 RepID=A0ABQ8JMU2_DERPT|nr:hypothetical protein DERP_005519 [Dermatophagoides pteronyssinus]